MVNLQLYIFWETIAILIPCVSQFATGRVHGNRLSIYRMSTYIPVIKDRTVSPRSYLYNGDPCICKKVLILKQDSEHFAGLHLAHICLLAKYIYHVTDPSSRNPRRQYVFYIYAKVPFCTNQNNWWIIVQYIIIQTSSLPCCSLLLTFFIEMFAMILVADRFGQRWSCMIHAKINMINPLSSMRNSEHFAYDIFKCKLAGYDSS